ncbi:hypothetical protein BDN72DRAFT_849461 [Pluteus cervinus]|uniref:Uncharacterized protein n=1 Tax=Pluteus cervinus TaxID=181527 RepID=A0ACD3AA39_9AGAR|nr:hypothetical protein BDN72DRAFT_849461 [Pluteus cervinus]
MAHPAYLSNGPGRMNITITLPLVWLYVLSRKTRTLEHPACAHMVPCTGLDVASIPIAGCLHSTNH